MTELHKSSMQAIRSINLQAQPEIDDSPEYLRTCFERQLTLYAFQHNSNVKTRSFTYYFGSSPEDFGKYKESCGRLKSVVEDSAEKCDVLFEEDEKGKTHETTYFNENFMVYLVISKTHYRAQFWYLEDIALFNPEMVTLQEWCNKDPEAENNFSVLISRGSSLDTKELSKSTEPLIEMNYVPEVVRGYEKLLEELQADNPNGRLNILEGPPGTGKTYLIKSLPIMVPRSKFIIIPPALVSQLGDPNIIGSLLNVKEEAMSEEHKSITLILEDADDCLRRRDGGNGSLVSSLLNASSGILGSSLNLRLIATSNLDRNEIDEAAMRPGRLGTYIQVGSLDTETATNVYRRITKDDEATYDHNKHGLSLAEVYGHAAKSGKVDIKFNKKEKKKIGF